MSTATIRAAPARFSTATASAPMGPDPSSEDLLPSGVPPEQHLAAIGRLKSELAALEQTKAALEGKRLNLLAAARRLGVLDDYELAALSGLQRETIRKMTWGFQPDSGVIPA
ncbi:hypothetical protein ABFP37_15650 [Burkholderia sp. RS01]|uniref:hypothetical protein n=1 Tax=unclassified Burkholderia TaxID=2613784 RepID=UPI0032187560